MKSQPNLSLVVAHTCPFLWSRTFVLCHSVFHTCVALAFGGTKKRNSRVFGKSGNSCPNIGNSSTKPSMYLSILPVPKTLISRQAKISSCKTCCLFPTVWYILNLMYREIPILAQLDQVCHRIGVYYHS